MELGLSDGLVFWHWFIGAGVLLIIEMLLPVFFFLWVAAAAVVTGVLVLIFPGMSTQWQLILFALLSVLSIVIWWKMRLTESNKPQTSSLNRRGHQYIDRVFTLDAPIENGVGKVSVDDSTWKINGPELPAGQKIKVVDVDGVVFIVEPI